MLMWVFESVHLPQSNLTERGKQKVSKEGKTCCQPTLHTVWFSHLGKYMQVFLEEHPMNVLLTLLNPLLKKVYNPPPRNPWHCHFHAFC